MTGEEALQLRRDIAQRTAAGQHVAAIAHDLGCSRSTVYRVLRLGSEPDARAHNRGRPPVYPPTLDETVRAARDTIPTAGPFMLHALMTADPAAYGLAAEMVPSPATLARIIHRLGIAHRPVGPHDPRTYPDAPPTAAGYLTVDTWGPWHVRADRVYLATVQDRFTRLTAAVPAYKLSYPPPGDPAQQHVGVTTRLWAQAVTVGQRYLSGGACNRVYSDNGIGMVPASRTLPFAARTVLRSGARLIFIPPAQPWRNGRLERFHYTMERQYWSVARPTSMSEALDGLTEFLNYYNLRRPHSSLRFKAPGEAFTQAEELPARFWEVDVAPCPLPMPGVVEAIRIVYNDGQVDLWGNPLHISPALAGQYVRVQFRITGNDQTSTGEVVYEGRKGLPLTVARFAHCLDVPGVSQHRPLASDVELVDFTDELGTSRGVIPNQRLDEVQLERQMARVLKRGKRREQEKEPQV